ncbi:hypothetical protein CDAR_592971 [Caerostris darwini]|nr:hypothetical protein CDAR_592971 [Caerostris darwini]
MLKSELHRLLFRFCRPFHQDKFLLLGRIRTIYHRGCLSSFYRCISVQGGEKYSQRKSVSHTIPRVNFSFYDSGERNRFLLLGNFGTGSQVVESFPFSSVLCKTENLIAAPTPFSQLIVS